MDILLPVANKRKIIILMNRDKSFTFFTKLSSVSRSRNVNSSNRDVNISTVSDSARKAWSQKLFNVWIRCFASRKLSSATRSSGRSKTWAICNVMVSIRPSVCSASSRYCGTDGPASGPTANTFCIFFKASTLRVGSLLKILDMVTVISSDAGVYEAGSSLNGLASSAMSSLDGGCSSVSGCAAVYADGCVKFGRGRPSLDGNMLFGRPISRGDVGTAACGLTGKREGRTGDSERGIEGAVGDPDRAVWAGDVGRANRDAPAIEGLADRGGPAIRERAIGEAGRGAAATRRATAGAAAGGASLS